MNIGLGGYKIGLLILSSGAEEWTLPKAAFKLVVSPPLLKQLQTRFGKTALTDEELALCLAMQYRAIYFVPQSQSQSQSQIPKIKHCVDFVMEHLPAAND